MSTQRTPVARIGIVEDHRRYRDALQTTIELIAEVEIAWAADGSEAALGMMANDPVDLAIVDLSLPDESGMVLIGRLRQSWPDTACVVVSGHTETSYVRRAFEAGAVAYVVKGRPADLRGGIAAGLRRERFVSPVLGAGPPADHRSGTSS